MTITLVNNSASVPDHHVGHRQPRHDGRGLHGSGRLRSRAAPAARCQLDVAAARDRDVGHVRRRHDPGRRQLHDHDRRSRSRPLPRAAITPTRSRSTACVTDQGNNTSHDHRRGKRRPRADRRQGVQSRRSVRAGTNSRVTVTLTRAAGAVGADQHHLTDSAGDDGCGIHGDQRRPPRRPPAPGPRSMPSTARRASASPAGASPAAWRANTSCTIALDVATPAAGHARRTTRTRIPAVNVTNGQGVVPRRRLAPC